MSVAIRRIRPGDGPSLKSIRLAAPVDTPSAFGSSYADEAARPDEEWNRRAGRSSAGDAGILYLAWSDDLPVGIVGGFRPDESPNHIELVSMWVALEARQSGIAGGLVGAVLEWASDSGAESVMLWVTEGNAPAHALYESVGFRVTGEHKPLPSDPAHTEVRMRLTPTPSTRDTSSSR